MLFLSLGILLTEMISFVEELHFFVLSSFPEGVIISDFSFLILIIFFVIFFLTPGVGLSYVIDSILILFSL